VLFVQSTQSEGGVTEKDLALAGQIDALARDAAAAPATG
jgi:pterin-4a-carbinolamine dehydratase